MKTDEYVGSYIYEMNMLPLTIYDCKAVSVTLMLNFIIIISIIILFGIV